MIYDCFPFFNELEVLDIRLHELDPVVDRFVIIEATQTHQGNPKSLIFQENEHLFKKFLPKIRYFGIDFPKDLEEKCHKGLYKDDPHVHKPNTGLDMNWARERWQHDAIMQGLVDCKDDDVILLCDLDEIPTAECVKKHERHMGIRYIHMRSFYYYLNVNVGDWDGPAKITPYDLLKQSTFSKMRALKVPLFPDSNGWHYAYMGGAGRIVEKIKSFAHAELNTSGNTVLAFQNRLDSGLSIEGLSGFDYSNYTIFPKYVEKNKEKFEKMGLIRYSIGHSTIPAGPYRCVCA